MITRLYFAYGSNLNLIQMKRRCPDAKPIGQMIIKGWKLVFRGVADIVPEKGGQVFGGIWRITEADERKLDTYEGVRGGLYRKVYLPIRRFQGDDRVLVYVMNSDGIYPPSQGYLDGIVEGYTDFMASDEHKQWLGNAVQDSWDDKRPSHKEHARNWRYGFPKLARPKNDCKNCGFCPHDKPSKFVLAAQTLINHPAGKAVLNPSVLRKVHKALRMREQRQCEFEWKGGRCARENGHPNGHRIQ